MTPPSCMAVVAGTGLNLRDLFDTISWEKPFHAFGDLSSGGVPGHANTFIEGTCRSMRVIVQQGRRHFYEGLTFEDVTAPVRVLASLGVDRVVFTNAAGGLKSELEPGALMAVEHILTWPYRGWPDRPPRIVPTWLMPGCDATGAYAWVHGPSYETRAEIAALQRQGACAVGMSTAPEMTAAHTLGCTQRPFPVSRTRASSPTPSRTPGFCARLSAHPHACAISCGAPCRFSRKTGNRSTRQRKSRAMSFFGIRPAPV